MASLFLNRDANNIAVTAPAYSLTKIMTVVVPVLTAVSGLAIDRMKKDTFSDGQVTALIIAVIGFLTIVIAADLLARGIATGRQPVAIFPNPIGARLAQDGPDASVDVIACSSGDETRFLCRASDAQTWTWAPAGDVTFRATGD